MESSMFRTSPRFTRWIMLTASGAALFGGAANCDLALQGAQTGLLTVIAGTLYFLARNV
jgi:hypothetical protein